MSFPIKNGGSFHSYVSLPEGINIYQYLCVYTDVKKCFGGCSGPTRMFTHVPPVEIDVFALARPKSNSISVGTSDVTWVCLEMGYT